MSDGVMAAKQLVDAEPADTPGHSLRIDIIKGALELLALESDCGESVAEAHTYARLRACRAKADRRDRIREEVYNLRALLQDRYPDGLMV